MHQQNLFLVGPNSFKHRLGSCGESADTSMYKTCQFCPSVTVTQKSPQCISCIFMSVFSLFIFFRKRLNETNPRNLSFFHQDIGICSSGSFRWSRNIKVLNKVSLCFGNEQASWDKQKQKRMRERQKSRQEVSCSWTCGRYRSARTHIHTSFTTLRTTPQFDPTLPKPKPLRKTWSSRQRRGDSCK